MPQTTIQKQSSIRFGSGLLEIGDTFGSLFNMGAVRNIIYVSLKEDIEVPFDNTKEVKRFKNGQDAQFTFDMAENDLTTIQKMEDGYMNLTTVPGVLVPAAIQTVLNGAWLEDQFIVLENQNGDGSAVTVNTVTGSADGLLVAGDDYEVISDSTGKFGIVLFLSGAALTTEVQDLTIDYDYTPSASKNATFNDFGTKILKVVRMTNTDENAKKFIFNLSDITNITPITFPFLADDADDVSTIAVTLKGTIVDWVDEQSTT